MCFLSILNQQKLHGRNIYISIYLRYLEINACVGAIHLLYLLFLFYIYLLFTSTETMVESIQEFNKKIKLIFKTNDYIRFIL